MREQGQDGRRTGTSCDYCATYITNIFHIVSSDGQKSVIGSSCIAKLGDKGLEKVVSEKLRQHRYEVRRQRELAKWEAERPAREALENERKEKETALVNERKALFAQMRPVLASTPHPNAYFASKGKTMIDYLNYFHGDIDNLSDEFWTYDTKLLNAIEEL